MTRFRSILVVTDFSAHANNAVRNAAVLAASQAARLTMLHVVDPTGCSSFRRWFSASNDIDLKTAQTRTALRQFAAEIAGRHGVCARFRVVVGDPFEEIRRASDGADLVVLGHRGKNKFKDLMVGSTADRLLRHCRKPMLVVKQALEAPYRRILVPVDFTAYPEASLLAAALLGPDANTHVVHAIAPGQELEMQMADLPVHVIREYLEIETEKALARMNRIVAKLGMDTRRLSTTVRRGAACLSTLDVERSFRADLIVAGKQGRSAMAEFLLGGVTRRLLTRSSCDILIVPRAATESLLSRSAVMTHRTLASGISSANLARSPAATAANDAQASLTRDGAQRRLAMK